MDRRNNLQRHQRMGQHGFCETSIGECSAASIKRRHQDLTFGIEFPNPDGKAIIGAVDFEVVAMINGIERRDVKVSWRKTD